MSEFLEGVLLEVDVLRARVAARLRAARLADDPAMRVRVNDALRNVHDSPPALDREGVLEERLASPQNN